MLRIIHEVPLELYECHVTDVHKVLKGPTLIHLNGENKDALFLSVLLHGNETTSFLVLQKLLKDIAKNPLKRDLIIFVGNTLAAESELRHLEGQLDYNRIWKRGDAPEYEMTQKIMNYAKSRNLFANIDIHNNTGNNPFYGCINKLDSKFLSLASLFSKKIVYFTEPHEVESMAFSKICPSITVEAGKSGNELATDLVFNFVKKVMNLDTLESGIEKKGIKVFHTIGRILVNPKAFVNFHFDCRSKGQLSFIEGLENCNFNVLRRGECIAKYTIDSPIKVIDNGGNEITDLFFDQVSGNLIVNQNFIPSMFTKDISVMKSDCLGYIMEKILSV